MDKCLQRPLLAVCPEKQRLKVNLHHTIPLLIRESDLMAKMDLPIPTIALTLYAKQEHFTLVQDSLQVPGTSNLINKKCNACFISCSF